MIKLFPLFFLLSFNLFALDIPYLSGRVVDNAGIINTRDETIISNSLKLHEKKTSNQIVVLTIDSLKEESLDGFALKVVEKWKLGQKGKDNGVLLLVSKNDRKLRIEVGYGLEGKLTDLKSNRIIRNIIVPHFKAGKYSTGINKGVWAIISTLDGKYQPPARRPRQLRKKTSTLKSILILIFFVFFAFSGRRRGRYYGGFASGGSSFGGGFSGGGGSFGGGGSSGSW